MTTTMYDGINSLVAGIHLSFPDTAYVAGYVNGSFAWTQAQWNLFPHAVKVQVSVDYTANEGDVIDCEAGDATAAQAASWVELRRAHGYYRPTVYTVKGNIPAVRAATGSLVLGKDYDIWCADWTGSPHEVTSELAGGVTATCAATQYLNTVGYDASAVYLAGWPLRTEPTVTPPAPASLSATPWLLIDMAWSVVEVNGAPSPHYRYQIAEGTPAKVGKVVVSETVIAVHATATIAPGTYVWRVQGAGNAAFSAWKAV